MVRQTRFIFSFLILNVLFPLLLQAAQPYGTDLGQFNGVTAYSNGTVSNVSNLPNYVNGTYTGMKWQCVEYVRRFYLSYYGVSLYTGSSMNANEFYSRAAEMGLNSYPNDGTSTIAPQVGDILVSNGGSNGHVAIVRSISGSQVCTIQQNFSNDSNDVNNRCLSLTLSNGHYTVGNFSNSYPVYGWLRTVSGTPLGGTWVGSINVPPVGPIPFTFVLDQSGQTVSGSYDAGGISYGPVSGTLVNDILTFTLTEQVPTCPGNSYNGNATLSSNVLTINNLDGLFCNSFPVSGVTGTLTRQAGALGNLVISPNSYDFGAVDVGYNSSSSSFTASNSGTADVTVGGISLSGADTADFGITADNCSGSVLAPSGTCTIDVVFAPSSYGSKTANLVIPSDAPSSPAEVLLFGTAGASNTSTVGGTVHDDAYNPVPGADVAIGTYSAVTGSDGSYSLPDLPSGSYTVTISKSGYVTSSQTLSVPPSTTVTKDFQLIPLSPPGNISIVGITSKYSGHVYYLDGVDQYVTFHVDVDWGGHPPGSVKFRTPNGTYDVAVTGTSASREFSMGTDFGPCGKLYVRAVSSDGSSSGEQTADFTVMAGSPLFAPPLEVYDTGDNYYYESLATTAINLFNEGVVAGVIPSNIPLFGGEGFNLSLAQQFIPQVSSNGQAVYQIDFNNALGVQGKMAGFSLKLDTPELYIEGAFSDSTCSWGWSGNVSVAGSAGISKSWPFVFMAGPVPVPMYAKASLNVAANTALDVLNLDPVSLNGGIDVAPSAEGSLGAGFDEVLSVEGWLGGNADMQLQWPTVPTLQNLTIHLNGGTTVYAFLWKWENNLLTWDWDYYNSLTAPVFTASALSVPQPELVSRDYLKKPGYGSFSKVSKYSVTTATVGAPGIVTTVLAPVQTTIFPYSESHLSSAGTNLYLAWLYDDPNRTAINRTEAVFSSWDGTAWSDPPQPIQDDGTADFHPDLRTFTDGTSIAAWEDEKTVLPDTAVFNDMVDNLEISVARFDKPTLQWVGAQRLTDNAFLDRSPKVAGTAPDNVLLTWIGNEANDITGSSTNPNKLWFSLWDGTAWSTPAVAAVIPYGIIKYSTVYDGTNGSVVFSLDTNDDLSTIDDRELFKIDLQSGVWGSLTQLTSDAVADDNPQMAIDPGGHFVLTWLKGSELSGVVDFDFANREVILSDMYSTNLADFKLSASSEGKLCIVWAEPSDYSSDLQAVFYDPIFQVWGSPKQLTADDETERNITAAFYGSDTIIAVYDRNLMGSTTVVSPAGVGVTAPVQLGTDLYMLKYTMGEDLALEGASLTTTPPNPAPGTNIALSVKAMNLGDIPFSDVPVAFYLGDPANGGTLIGQTIIPGVLSPGGVANASLNWTVPATTTPLEIFAVIDPAASLDPVNRFNNVTSTTTTAPDLTVKSVNWQMVNDHLISITARVSNEGSTASGNTTVRFKDDSNGGALLYTGSVGPLSRFESADVNFVWDVSGLSMAQYPLTIVVDEANAVTEFDETNNQRDVTVNNECMQGTDTDGDGVGDACDNCILKANGPLILDAGGNIQLDTDGDGYGNMCDPEYGDPDNVVGIGDFNIFRASWLKLSGDPAYNPDCDHDGDGVVGISDFNVFRDHWLGAPGPSGLVP